MKSRYKVIGVGFGSTRVIDTNYGTTKQTGHGSESEKAWNLQSTFHKSTRTPNPLRSPERHSWNSRTCMCLRARPPGLSAHAYARRPDPSGIHTASVLSLVIFWRLSLLLVPLAAALRWRVSSERIVTTTGRALRVGVATDTPRHVPLAILPILPVGHFSRSIYSTRSSAFSSE